MDSVVEFLEHKVKLRANDVIVLGNSGGPDSMCLLHLLLDIRKKIPIKIVCAHVNHNVRKESFQEERFLQNFCEKNDLVFEYMLIENYSDDNFHSQARKIRYNFFKMLVQKYEANYLMTAHHGDDLVETILMRMVRGSTLKGYGGFSSCVDCGTYQMVRPLIFVTKQEIIDYNEKYHIDYVIDKSNFKDKYTRNRYRSHILPFLKEEDSQVHKKFLKFSNVINDFEVFFEKILASKMKEIYIDNKLKISKFIELDSFVQKQLIYKMLGEIYKDDLVHITDVHVELILELIYSKKANSFVCLPRNFKAFKYYDCFEIKEDIEGSIDYEIEIDDYVKLPLGHSIKKVDFCDTNGNDVCRLTFEDVQFPLYVRTRRLGDKLLLKKVNGYRKVKDIFIDAKIPLIQRDAWPIVVDSKGKVLWIPGVKKSKFAKQKSERYDIILRYD